MSQVCISWLEKKYIALNMMCAFTTWKILPLFIFLIWASYGMSSFLNTPTPLLPISHIFLFPKSLLTSLTNDHLETNWWSFGCVQVLKLWKLVPTFVSPTLHGYHSFVWTLSSWIARWLVPLIHECCNSEGSVLTFWDCTEKGERVESPKQTNDIYFQDPPQTGFGNGKGEGNKTSEWNVIPS